MQPTPETLLSRQRQFQQKLLERGVSKAFITKKENIYYLTGLSPVHPTEREAFLLINQDEVLLYHSPFVIPQKNAQVKNVRMSPNISLQSIAVNFYSSIELLGVEKDDLTVTEYEKVQNIFPSIDIIAVDDIFREMRLIKDSLELCAIKNACKIAEKSMKWIMSYSSSGAALGITEIQMAKMLEQKMFEFGASYTAFPTIVAFNSHAASPHHVLSPTKLTKNSIILIDMGADVAGYKSDMTRTWCIGSPPPSYIKIESIVLKAYRAAKKLVQTMPSGLNVAAIDSAARSIIEAAGYGDKFIHTTGHGIGLEAHESPSVNSNNYDAVSPGMVITIEPGIYLPGKFGYRHEDTFIID